ncbi:MAG: UPF0147 family protein [Candidatus Woesearchaeota archaeon]
MEPLQQALAILDDLRDDSTLPRNVRQSITSIFEMLSDESIDISIRVDKAMLELEQICSDANIQSYSRTMLYQVTSNLENAI